MRLPRYSLFLPSILLSASQHMRFASAISPSKNSSASFFSNLLQLPFSSKANMTDSNQRLAPVICISHGGGPMPVLGDPSHTALVKSLKTRVPKILKLNTPEQPRAIVLVTAHWQTADVTISSGEKHQLYYDYHGFPKEAYALKYDAPGSPQVAEEVKKALEKEGIRSVLDGKRGWDHGVFIPMLLIHPAANIPIIQLSVLSSESPSAHFAYGRALASLRAQNIAIVGSGFASLHNLGVMFSGIARTPEFKRLNEEWSAAVDDAASTEDETLRREKFDKWRSWPGAYKMHPPGGAEHFLPLVVCAGAAGTGKAKSYADEFIGLKMWSFYWD